MRNNEAGAGTLRAKDADDLAFDLAANIQTYVYVGWIDFASKKIQQLARSERNAALRRAAEIARKLDHEMCGWDDECHVAIASAIEREMAKGE